MYILATDCSAKQSSVAIASEDKLIYTAVQNVNVTHSANFMLMVESALKVRGIDFSRIGLLAPTVGPGSFTGIRIGLAAVKGMAAVYNTPCIGISSLMALAKRTEREGIVIPAFDARRGQVYACVSDGDTQIVPDFCAHVSRLEPHIKNSAKDVYFVGDGAPLCYGTYGHYANVKPLNMPMPCIAAGAAELAYKIFKEKGRGTHFDLTPSYLRLSQAERELMEKNGQKPTE